MRIYLFIILFSAIVLTSCEQSGTCLDNLVCTEELRYISVEVKDNLGNPVTLDSAYTIHKESGFVFRNEEFLGLFEEGNYIIWSDLEMDRLDKKGSELTFEGWKENQKLISESYKVGHDCCHITLIDGNTQLSLP